MSVTEVIGAVVGSGLLILLIALFGWMMFELARTWITGQPNRFRAWAESIEVRVWSGPRVIKWPYFFVKWALAAAVAASFATKAIDELHRGEPAGGVALVVGLPVSFLIHFLSGLAKHGHRDGA